MTNSPTLRHAWRSLVLVSGGALGSACAATAARTPDAAASVVSAAPAARGTLYIVGGGPQPPALVREFVDLAGGTGRARIVVFAMASADGAASGEAKARDLRALGAQATNVWITREQADTDSIARLVDAATGVWFGGGDQNRLAAVLRDTRTGAAIRRRYEAGAVVGGTSAGAAVMSAAMITGEERRPGGARPVAEGGDGFVTIDRDDVVLAPGFGLLSGAIVDQHFLRRRRHNRLLSVVLEQPTQLAVGVDESTALIVEPGGRWRVAGASVAVVYDARRATTTTAGTALGGAHLVLHVLPAGSRFDPRTGRATLPPAPGAGAP
jgi:cyanophycinase